MTLTMHKRWNTGEDKVLWLEFCSDCFDSRPGARLVRPGSRDSGMLAPTLSMLVTCAVLLGC